MALEENEAIESFGITMVFATSGFTAKIVDTNIGDRGRESIPTHHQGTTEGWMTKRPSKLKNPGQITLKVLFDGDTEPPVNDANDCELITITYPVPRNKTNGAVWACQGFVSKWSQTGSIGARIEADLTIELSGKPTYTASS